MSSYGPWHIRVPESLRFLQTSVFIDTGLLGSVCSGMKLPPLLFMVALAVRVPDILFSSSANCIRRVSVGEGNSVFQGRNDSLNPNKG